MPLSTVKPEQVACIEVAGRIVSALIQNGKIECNTESIGTYFDEVYKHITHSVSGK